MQKKEFNHGQRIQHIVTAYGLTGEDPERFNGYLSQMMATFPLPLIELALVETLVRQWLQVPLKRGLAFLEQAHAMLVQWQQQMFEIRVTPPTFEMITGLDPTPLFQRLEGVLHEFVGAADSIDRATAPTPATEMP